jgi:hypothetical protein
VNEKPTECKAATFAWMIPHLTTVARIYGYAIGLHGSMNRDLDLIAVPWTESAAPAETLVEAIRDAVDGSIRNDPPTQGNKYDQQVSNPNDKPHGRRAWSIYFSGRRFYIDLSVMPRIVRPREPDTNE